MNLILERYLFAFNIAKSTGSKNIFSTSEKLNIYLNLNHIKVKFLLRGKLNF